MTSSIQKPEVTTGINRHTFNFQDIGILVEVSRLTDDGKGLVTVRHKQGEKSQLLLPKTKANLFSVRDISQLVTRLEKNAKQLDWTTIFTYVTEMTTEEQMQGEPVLEIWPSDEDTLKPEYLLEPILYRNHPNVIFGDYGSLKSLEALVLAYVVQLPYHDNQLGLRTSDEVTRCLYLDYEDDPSSFRKRWSALEKGFGQGAMPILYRRMTAPLCDSVERVGEIINESKAGLLIVDSLGPAARGNLNDPEPAIRYHGALRQLGITSLTLAHCAKDTLSKKRTIFGSVFFTNLARSVWECKAGQEPGENEAIISLNNTKANLSRKHPTLGYRFGFTDSSITVSRVDLQETGLSGELPLSTRIKALLRRGPMSVKAISEALEANDATVRTVVYRMTKRGEFTKVGDLWGLSQ